MDNKKLEQIAKSEVFITIKELFDELVIEGLNAPYDSRIAEEVALEALSREKSAKMVRDMISLIERSVAGDTSAIKRSFK